MHGCVRSDLKESSKAADTKESSDKARDILLGATKHILDNNLILTNINEQNKTRSVIYRKINEDGSLSLRGDTFYEKRKLSSLLIKSDLYWITDTGEVYQMKYMLPRLLKENDLLGSMFRGIISENKKVKCK